jgi:hypothetical protein
VRRSWEALPSIEILTIDLNSFGFAQNMANNKKSGTELMAM